jgi:type I restriction enzyme S subunit
MKVHEERADYFVIPNMDSAVFKAARLGDVTESMKNGLYKPASEYGDDGVPCLRMYNIDAGQIVWRNIKRMRVSASELEDYGLIEGDLLVNRVNSRELVGKTALIPPGMGPSVFESKNIRLRLKTDQAVPKFINYQLLGFGRQHFSNNAQQVVGMASVSQKQLADFPIVLAPLDQQKRIVAEIEKQFSRLDEAVANLKRVKANLKRYKAAVLKAAVEGRLVETEAERARREGRSYETGEQLLQRILETRRSQWQGKGKYKEPAGLDTTDLSELPMGWAWTDCDVVLDRIEAGASFKCTERPPVEDETGVLKVSAVTWGVFNELESKTCMDPDRIEERYLIQEGDFLFSRANTIDLVGACVIVRHVSKRLMLSDKTLRFRISSLVSEEWLLICLRSKWGRLEIQRLATGNQESMRNIGQNRIRKIRIPLPPLSEQIRVTSEIDRWFSLCEVAQAQVIQNLNRASGLRTSILSAAFKKQ